MLNSLATELILQILCSVTPDDIGSLRLSSKRLFGIIQQHDAAICTAIAETHGLGPDLPFILDVNCPHRISPLRSLQSQWQRYQLVGQILGISLSYRPSRRSVELFCDYHDVLRLDARNRTLDTHRRFVLSLSKENLSSLLATIRICAWLVLEACEPHVSKVDKILGNRNMDAWAELVIQEGPQFMVRMVGMESLDVMERFGSWGVTRWNVPQAKTAISRLSEEQRWKAKLASLQTNTLL